MPVDPATAVCGPHKKTLFVVLPFEGRLSNECYVFAGLKVIQQDATPGKGAYAEVLGSRSEEAR